MQHITFVKAGFDLFNYSGTKWELWSLFFLLYTGIFFVRSKILFTHKILVWWLTTLPLVWSFLTPLVGGTPTIYLCGVHFFTKTVNFDFKTFGLKLTTSGIIWIILQISQPLCLFCFYGWMWFADLSKSVSNSRIPDLVKFQIRSFYFKSIVPYIFAIT